MTTIIDVKIRLMEPMLGTVPKDREVYKTYIESKKPAGVDSEVETVEQIEEKGWTGFHADDGGLFVYDYLVKGFIKEAGNTLKEAASVKGLRSKIDNYLFVFPRRIHLGQSEPDGVIERPLRAQTMQGPRVTLARSDYINAGKELSFEVHLLEHKEVSVKLVRSLMDYGKYKGLGQFRNGSYGRFEVVSWEQR